MICAFDYDESCLVRPLWRLVGTVPQHFLMTIALLVIILFVFLLSSSGCYHMEINLFRLSSMENR